MREKVDSENVLQGSHALIKRGPKSVNNNEEQNTIIIIKNL